MSEEEEDEVKKKTKVLDEFKIVVKGLQCDDVLWGAKEIRRLTKEDPHARTTLALLGSIPTLVGMLDCKENDVEFQISALYALLNLGIANPELVHLFFLCFRVSGRFRVCQLLNFGLSKFF